MAEWTSDLPLVQVWQCDEDEVEAVIEEIVGEFLDGIGPEIVFSPTL